MTEPTHTFTASQLSARDDAVTRRALQMVLEMAQAEKNKQSKKDMCMQESGFSMMVIFEKALEAILALQPPATRWQEVPEGSVVVSVEAAHDQWASPLVRCLMRWVAHGKSKPRYLFDDAKNSGLFLPKWVASEPEMARLDHTVSKGTVAVMIYRAMIDKDWRGIMRPTYQDKTITIYGPHGDGSFNMSYRGSWVAALFDSIESAKSWRHDLNGAEAAYSGSPLKAKPATDDRTG